MFTYAIFFFLFVCKVFFFCFLLFSPPLHSPNLLSVSSLMPWMELDGEYLYLSQAENIQAYRLCPDGTGLQRHPQAIFSGHQEDVCRFVLVNSNIVSGGG